MKNSPSPSFRPFFPFMWSAEFVLEETITSQQVATLISSISETTVCMSVHPSVHFRARAPQSRAIQSFDVGDEAPLATSRWPHDDHCTVVWQEKWTKNIFFLSYAPGAEFRPSPTCWTQWKSPLTVISGVEWGLNEPTWGFSGKIEQKSDFTWQVWFSQTRTNFWYLKWVASAKLSKFFRSGTKLRIREIMEWVGCGFWPYLARFLQYFYKSLNFF